MTQTQRIIASSLKNPSVKDGMRVYIKENHPALSDDSLCGAYGKLCLKENPLVVPKGVFVNLDGALRNDVSGEEIAQYVLSFLQKEALCGLSVEFGGDSMGYLTMNERIEIVKTLSNSRISPFCVIFECDYITAEYTLETFGEKPSAFYNDGPESFEKILVLNLGEI
jgi:homoaconitase/3-isopropylmalate dehydratase large subunit